MDPSALRNRLEDGPLVADGGMGTSLIERGAGVGDAVEALNIGAPQLVGAVHRSFVAAGARLVLTNTFGANRYRLSPHGWGDRVHEVNVEGVGVAREAGAEIVGGSMGPLGIRLAPYGRVKAEDAFAAYAEQAEALADGGADLLVIETQADLRELEQALLAARQAAPGLAVLASVTFTRDDRTLLGSTPEQAAARSLELGADAIGVNCGEGPAQVLRVVRAMRPVVGDTPLAARPNAGGPAEVGGRLVYPATPTYLGELMHALLDEGVAIVGGCCGTGPAHTAAIVEATKDRGPRPRVEVVSVSDPPDLAAAPSSTELTALAAALASDRFAVAVEMEPPRSFSAATLVAAAQTMKEAGADVVDVADSPMAKMRMSAWAACRLVQEQAGIDTVLHFPTRGRNLLRLQGDLLGVHALGIRTVFVCVGDPVTIGDYPQTLNDVDVTATGLLSLITDEFNEGRDRKGSSIGEPTTFFAGAAVAPSAPDLEREARLLTRRSPRGRRSSSRSRCIRWLPSCGCERRTNGSRARRCRCPCWRGCCRSSRPGTPSSCTTKCPGIAIPDAARTRLRAAGEDAWRNGLAMASELIAALKADGVAGVYVMPQFGRYDLAAEVVEAARRA